MMSTPHIPSSSSAASASAAGASAAGATATRAGSAPAFLTGSAGALPSRTVAVLEAIKHAILAGELKPGQALVETDLAEVLGVSKTPVREALKTLAGAGLVCMSPYKGAVVRVVDDVQARHVYDARLLIEPEALANRVFHRELYAGCGNPLLITMLDDLRDQTALVSAAAWRRDPDHAPTPSWEHEAAEHRAVLRAAEDGDAERAARLLRDHITSFVARNFPEPQENQHR